MWADRKSGAFHRRLRTVWPGSNPLRRGTDWFEACAVFGALMAMLVAVVLSVATSQMVLRNQLEQVRAEQANRHQVVAEVLTETEEQGSLARLVAVRWGAPEDERFATVRVAASAEVGETIPIWLGPDEQPMPPPKTRAEASQASGTAGAGVLIGSAVVTGLALSGLSWWVNRRRLAAWEAEWEWIEPRWRNHTL
ncbi:Rv1733c family protein [Parasphingorhabdus pacifica]